MDSSNNYKLDKKINSNLSLKLWLIFFFSFVFALFQSFVYYNGTNSFSYILGTLIGNIFFFSFCGFIPAFIIKLFSWKAPIDKFLKNALIFTIIIGGFLTFGNAFNFFTE